MTDSEAVSAGQEAGARVVRFVVRANALSLAITSDDWLQQVGADRVWRVTGAIEGNKGRRRSVQITAVERSDGARV